MLPLNKKYSKVLYTITKLECITQCLAIIPVSHFSAQDMMLPATTNIPSCPNNVLDHHPFTRE